MTKHNKIPTFSSDEQAAAFWETHDIIDYYTNEDRVDLVVPNLKKTPSKRVQVQLPDWVIEHYKKKAQEKDMSYKDLIQSILTRSASRFTSHQ